MNTLDLIRKCNNPIVRNALVAARISKNSKTPAAARKWVERAIRNERRYIEEAKREQKRAFKIARNSVVRNEAMCNRVLAELFEMNEARKRMDELIDAKRGLQGIWCEKR